jgi:hypothetical protein
MKKKNKAHNDKPSTPLPEKVIEVGEVVSEGAVKKTKHTDGSKGNPLPPKTIEVGEIQTEGNVRETKYSVDENYTPDKTGTRTRVKSDVMPAYWLPDDEIDIYAVDRRIWDRLDALGGGDGGAPHTHDGLYSPTTHGHDDYLTELPTHDHPHGHDEYSPKSHLHPEYSGVAHDHNGDYVPFDDFVDIHINGAHASLEASQQALNEHLANHPSGGGGDGGSYDDTEVRGLIQDNADAIEGKADDPHDHPHNHNGLYSPTTHLHEDNYAQKTHTHDTSHNHDNQYAPTHNHPYASDTHKHDEAYAGKTHNHPAPDLSGVVAGLSGTGMGLWIGSQAEYDAISPKRVNNLYVVI